MSLWWTGVSGWELAMGGRGEGWGGVPVCGDDGVAFDVDAFGFGLLAHAVEGGFVLLLLEGACHFGKG